ncbi:carbohydrate porin [Photobacterium rosenbergii]|uniref:Carbohydrate porin n=1 Tax=Photobacterium rosenbergii TaxID=294936 RepID=A0ABU3ZEC3_9GAMM|nr:carbohydrate porin [Photobacterium rosenbergii]MDV5168450.1 carbohydrate porin [Photobacterium rosenbergii]
MSFFRLYQCMIPVVMLATTVCSPLRAEDTTFDNNLTGSWGGKRSALQNQGITLNGEYTGFYQNARNAEYRGESNLSHRVDLFTKLDLAKLGLWAGGTLNTQLVYRDGNANDLGFANLSVPNAGHYDDQRRVFVPSLYYTHTFSSYTQLMLGKIDAFELLGQHPFFGGVGRYGFSNIAFVAPPSGVVPPAFLGLVLNHNVGDTQLTAMVFDPRNRYTETPSFHRAFDEGVNVSLGLKQPFELAGRDSYLSLAYTFSSESGTDWNSVTDKPDNWQNTRYKYNLRAELGHQLYQRGNEHWGLYLRASIADGNPNIIEGTFAGGIGGSATMLGRPEDRWGLGVYYYNLSNDLQSSIDELPHDLKLNNEKGGELYYNYQLSGSINITADLQYLTPSSSNQSDAFIMGIRMNLRF